MVKPYIIPSVSATTGLPAATGRHRHAVYRYSLLTKLERCCSIIPLRLQVRLC